jgi:hypothetical protein
MPFSSKYLSICFDLTFLIYLFRKMEGNYKESERERDNLKKATQGKFLKLSNNHKSGEKLV